MDNVAGVCGGKAGVQVFRTFILFTALMHPATIRVAKRYRHAAAGCDCL